MQLSLWPKKYILFLGNYTFKWKTSRITMATLMTSSAISGCVGGFSLALNGGCGSWHLRAKMKQIDDFLLKTAGHLV